MPESEWTIQRLLNWITGYLTEKGVDAPRLSAELLLSNVLDLRRIDLYTQFNRIVDAESLSKLRALVTRAGEHEPVAYLVGKTEFYSLEFDLTPDCMIPRPETELLVQRAIEFLRTQSGPQRVCDLCTGCGCIAVAIAKNHPSATVLATDISDAALAVARRNVTKHDVGKRMQLCRGDLFDPVIEQLDQGAFGLVVCNPPYVTTVEMRQLDRNVREHEPHLALHGGVDGLDVYRRIADQAGGFLQCGGALMLEVGYAQGPAVRQLLESAGVFGGIRVEKDPHDNDRIVLARRN